jgi:hypothetical protein
MSVRSSSRPGRHFGRPVELDVFGSLSAKTSTTAGDRPRGASLLIVGRVLATSRFENTNDGYRLMRGPGPGLAGSGLGGGRRQRVGRQLAQRLVSERERTPAVQARLPTRGRAMGAGHGRKNDPADAHAVAVVGLRTAGLREVTVDDQMVALRGCRPGGGTWSGPAPRR